MALGQLLRPTMRAVQDPAWNLWGKGDDSGFGGATAAGERVTRLSALQLLTVYGCQSLISETIASMPIDTYRRLPDGTKEDTTPPAWLTGKANPETATGEFVQQSVVSLLADGNSFWAIVRGPRQDVIEAWTIDPQRVRVDRHNGRVVYLIDGKVYPGELVHIPAFTMPGALRGINPIEVARQAIGLGLAAQKFGAHFFTNSSIPSVVLSVPGDPPDDQLKQIRENWVRVHGNGSNLPGVVTGGATVTTLTIAPEQAQFLETRAYTAGEIAAQLYRVDPTMLGIKVEGSSITYQNVEQRGIEFIRWTLLPWIVRLERALTALVARSQYVKFNAAAFLRADTKTRYEVHKLALDTKMSFPDERRALEDEAPLPDGLGTAEAFLGKPSPPPAPEPPAPADDEEPPADPPEGDTP